MIYTLTLNPALDYDVYVDNFTEGKLNLSNEVNIRAGGKGINVSKMLNNLEEKSVALGFLGGFVGEYIKEDLTKEGIESKFIELEGITRINIVLNNQNKETEIAGISPSISKDKIKELINLLNEKLDDDDILVLSGSIPKDIDSNIYYQIADNLSKNIKVVLDTRGNLLDQNINKNYLIKPNIHELEEMFSKKFSSNEEIIKECNYFLNKGVENVIVSMGGDGALLITKSKSYFLNPPKGEFINSIGAGDSVVAGFVKTISNGGGVLEAFKLGVCAGSATAYSYGLGDKALVEKLFNSIKEKNQEVVYEDNGFTN